MSAMAKFATNESHSTIETVNGNEIVLYPGMLEYHLRRIAMLSKSRYIAYWHFQIIKTFMVCRHKP